jgi:hypothetical protein
MENHAPEKGTTKDRPLVTSSKVTAKASPNLKKVEYKATAGLTEEEILSRNVIGEIKKDEEEKE